jgi:hypothetical protein
MLQPLLLGFTERINSRVILNIGQPELVFIHMVKVLTNVSSWVSKPCSLYIIQHFWKPGYYHKNHTNVIFSVMPYTVCITYVDETEGVTSSTSLG